MQRDLDGPATEGMRHKPTWRIKRMDLAATHDQTARKAKKGRFDPFTKPPADSRYLREADDRG